MADAGDHGEDPQDGEEYAIADEVRAELARLQRAEWHSLELRARTLARGSIISPKELVHTAVERLLAPGERHWHPAETIQNCIARTMRSLVQDWWRRDQRSIVAANATSAGLRDDPGPHRIAAARQAFANLSIILEDDKNTLEIALAMAAGQTPTEIQTHHRITQTEYDTALKRIRRALRKLNRTDYLP